MEYLNPAASLARTLSFGSETLDIQNQPKRHIG